MAEVLQTCKAAALVAFGTPLERINEALGRMHTWEEIQARDHVRGGGLTAGREAAAPTMHEHLSLEAPRGIDDIATTYSIEHEWSAAIRLSRQARGQAGARGDG